MKARGQDYDVIVVGAGNAALCAALSASEAGATVLVLEKAPKSARGGNTRFTGLYRFAYGDMKGLRALIPEMTEEEARRFDVGRYTVDDFYRDLMRISQGRADPEMSQILAKESYPVVKWMVGMGVKWEMATELGWEKDGIRHFQPGMPSRPSGGGEGVLDQLFRIIEGRKGMEVRYETKAVKLLQDDTGRVCGVRVKDAQGFHDLQAKATIMACGGFEANPQMRAKYLGSGWDMVKVRGSRYDTGEGLEMLLELGAAATGQFSGSHAAQVFLSGPDVEMGDEAFAHSYPYCILVNVLGKRFVDEAVDFQLYTYARLGREVLAQPRALGFQIFDAKVTHLLADRYQKARGVTAKSIEELADLLEIDRKALVATVREYNAAVQDGEYNTAILDGKRAEGIVPPKSNWALKIDTPPFVSYPVTCGITFTFGGVKTDRNARVLDTEGNVVPGLYAIGELVGSFYYNYAGASGLIKGSVFGRIAGKAAAAEQKK